MRYVFSQDILLSASDEKVKVIWSIYQDIGNSWGRLRPLPDLAVYKKDHPKKFLAQYETTALGKSVIKIDEGLYDLCVQHFEERAEDALACILAHELAHHNRFHLDSPGFLQDSPKESLEEEADYYGLLYAFLAGYNSYNIFPEVLSTIYENYPLNLDKVIPKETRITQAITGREKLFPLVSMYEMANIALLAKEYSVAEACLESILEKLPSKEVYNNLGLCYLLRAIEATEVHEMGFVLPVEQDPATRILNGLSRNTLAQSTERTDYVKACLEKAILFSEDAIRIDPLYESPRINLGAARILHNEANLALLELEAFIKERRDAKLSVSSNVYTLIAIANCYSGKLEQAGSWFLKAKKDPNFVSNYNLRLYQEINQDQDFFSYLEAKWASYREKFRLLVKKAIGEKPEEHQVAFPDSDTEAPPFSWKNLPKINFEQAISINHKNRVYYLFETQNKEFQGFRMVYANPDSPSGNSIFEVLFPLSSYSGTTQKGLKVGASLQKVLALYGEGEFRSGSNQRSYIVYRKSSPKKGMGFRLNQSVVDSWFVYRIRPFF